MEITHFLFLIFFSTVLAEIYDDDFEERADLVERAPWNYSNIDQWGVNYTDCNLTNQSPIKFENINYERRREILQFSGYDVLRMGMILANEGNTVKLRFRDNDNAPACISGAGLVGRYCFTQLHFHWGLNNSQSVGHIIEGKGTRVMEMHLVHVNPSAVNNGSAGMAIIAMTFMVQAYNIKFGPITDALRRVRYNGQNTTVDRVKLLDLIPRAFARTASFFRYNGSLAAPPCTEGVIWNVYDAYETISQDQMNLFRELRRTVATDSVDLRIAPNFRPAQELNGRLRVLYGLGVGPTLI